MARIEHTITATVVTASPLVIIADGADTSNSAAIVTGLTVTANDRVLVTIRTPLLPLVQSIEVNV